MFGKSAVSIALVVPLLIAGTASAGRQRCGKQEVPQNVRTCPDGTIPEYVADEVKPYTSKEVQPYQAQPVQDPQQKPADRTPSEARPAPSDAKPGDLGFYYGVWRTRIPGAVWTSPSGYSGYDWLHVSTGVSVGDLIIRPDGTYIWNSYGGKKGTWVRGDAGYPIVLIDDVEKRKWKVGADPRHTGGRDIVIWDGNYYSYDGRR